MSYAAAALVASKLRQGDVYVSVINGKFRGTVGRIIGVQAHHYSKHSYHVECSPGRQIKMCGSTLQLCEPQELVFILNEDYTPKYMDFNERVIEVGDRIVVSKHSTSGFGADLLIGNVRRIDSKGVHFAPFAINGSYTNDSKSLVRLTKTSTAMIIDAVTGNSIMIQKLSAGSVE